MENYKGPERRKQKRVSCWLSMKYKRKEEDSEFKKAETKNITTIGVLFESEDVFYTDKYIEIELEISKEKLIKAIGKVIWSRKSHQTWMNEVGVEFTEIKQEDLKSIEKLISKSKEQ